MSSCGDTTDKEMRYVPSCLKALLIITGILIVIGCLNIYSSTFYMNIHSGGNAYSHIFNHLRLLFFGVAIALCMNKFSGSFVRENVTFGFMLTMILLLIVMVAGRTVNGATRWIPLGSFSFQPSEMAKVTALLWTSYYLAKQIDGGEKISVFRRFFGLIGYYCGNKRQNYSLGATLKYFRPLWAPLVMAVFVLKQPDMGTAGMIVIFPAILYILAGLPVIEILSGFIFAALIGFILIIIEPYRLDRLIVLWDPFSYSRDLGYQTVQSLIAVGSGGILGQGPAEGMSKFLYLPEQYTDFAYAVWSQEFGFLGAVIVLFLYLGFMYFGFSCARMLKHHHESLLVYGLTMLISVQGIINIAMVVGCFPVTGIPLPFISYGGSSLIMNIISVGVIWEATQSSLARSDKEERKRRIDAMSGRIPSYSKISGSRFRK